MTNNSILSINELESILNHALSAVIVSALDNRELLYANKAASSMILPECQGRRVTCYQVLGYDKPCPACPAGQAEPGLREVFMPKNGRTYRFSGKNIDWAGRPAHIEYISDISEQERLERERVLAAAIMSGDILEVSYRMRHKNGKLIWIHLNGRRIGPLADTALFYAVFTGMTQESSLFQSMVEQFPGGISMLLYWPDGTMKLEFVSHGFAVMTQRTVEEAMRLYDEDIFAGIHPDDVEKNLPKLRHFLESGEGPCELIARMKRKDGSYIWVSSQMSILQSADVRRIYIVYTDISKTVEEKERLRQRYEEQLFQHYHKPGVNELVFGHGNISQDRVVELRESTDSALLKRFFVVLPP